MLYTQGLRGDDQQQEAQPTVRYGTPPYLGRIGGRFFVVILFLQIDCQTDCQFEDYLLYYG